MTDDYKDDPNNEQQTKITGAGGGGGVVVSGFQNNPLPQYSSTNLSYASSTNLYPSSTNLVSDFENNPPLPSSTNLSIAEIPEATCVTTITSSSYVSKSDPVLSYTTAPTVPITPFTASTPL